MTKLKWTLVLLSIVICQKTTLADTAMEGIRGGVQLGYGLIDSKVTFARTLLPVANDNSDVSGRGAIGGFTVDWQGLIGNSDMLMGAEVSLNWSTCRGKKSTNGTFVLAPATSDLSTSVLFKRAFDFSFKIGYMAKGAALGYIKIGPSMSHWKASSTSVATNAAGSASTNMVGYLVGVGAEFPLSQDHGRLTWGAEWVYRSYKEFSHNLVTNDGVKLRQIGVRPSSNAIMLRINYKMSASDFTTGPEKKEKKRKKHKKKKPLN
jgi:opacity protein-like surface antigen